jgi:exosortase family protein XrtM
VSPSLRFVALFALLYGVFHGLYHLVPDRFLAEVVYRWGINEVAVTLINALAPAEQARAEGHRLISARAVLEIVRGCDGSGVFFIAAAAMLAFGAPWRYRLGGVATGFAVVYVLNLARVVGLYFAVAYRPAWFLPLHTFYIPTLLIVAIGLLFLVWAEAAVRAAPGHAR